MPKKSERTAPSAEADLAPMWFQAVLDNNVKTLDPSFGGSGFRTNHARFRSASFDNGSRLAETYLLNTRLQRHDRETAVSVMHYFTDEARVLLSLNGVEAAPASQAVALPRSVELSLRLSKCLSMRRSRRVFTADPLPLAALATLCRAAAGVTGSETVPVRVGRHATRVTIHFRAAPSPGGLYGIDL